MHRTKTLSNKHKYCTQKKKSLIPLDRINNIDISVSLNTGETVTSNMSLFFLSVTHKMSSQAPLRHFNVVLCVSNNTLLWDMTWDLFPSHYSQLLYTHYPLSSFCFNEMSTWKIDLHSSNPSPPTYSVLSWNKRCLPGYIHSVFISGLRKNTRFAWRAYLEVSQATTDYQSF